MAYLPAPTTWINATDFAGADIGAQVNSAFAFLLARGVGGTVNIPAGNYTFSNGIVFPNNLDNCQFHLRGEGAGANNSPAISNSFMNYTGTGSAITSLQTGESGGPPQLSGSIKYLTLKGPNSGANAANGIHIGNSVGFTIKEVEIYDFIGTDSAGIWLDNTLTGGYTERFDIDAVVSNCTNLIRVTNTNSLATGSFEHGRIWLNGETQASGQVMLNVALGASLARGICYINGNLANGSTEVQVDSTSSIESEWMYLFAENTAGGGANMFNVGTGGMCGPAGYFFNDGHLTTIGGGTLTAVGGFSKNWTPVDASGAALSLTVLYATINFTTNSATIVLGVTYPATGDTNPAKIGGLPQPCFGSGNVGCAVGFTDYTATVPLFAVVAGGTADIKFFNNSAGQLTNANLSGKTIELACTYPTQ